VLRTPLRRSDWLSGTAGGDVFLKLETLQPSFSYKIRGAFNAVLRLVERHGTDVPPLVTASAGNHGRALAHAARAAGLRLTVYVPADAPRTKIEAITQSGAELIPCGSYDEAESRAKAHAVERGALFVSPYAHPDVIAGAGTVALEILDAHPGIDTFVVPMGGGGLVSGIGIAAKASSPAATIIGVEVAASSPFTQSLAAGRIVSIDVRPTLADGLGGNLDPDTITFDLVRTLVDRIAIVQEHDLENTIAGLVREERIIAEGAGAAAAAAVASGSIAGRLRQTAVILSGANIDPEKLRALI
jgi:threonine dehydratase